MPDMRGEAREKFEGLQFSACFFRTRQQSGAIRPQRSERRFPFSLKTLIPRHAQQCLDLSRIGGTLDHDRVDGCPQVGVQVGRAVGD
jgi:hypothetical protein